MKTLFAALLLFAALTANPRELCTPDAQFTYCRWGQVLDCMILEDKFLQSNAFTESERSLPPPLWRRNAYLGLGFGEAARLHEFHECDR